jgi:hypothetical protein
MEQFDGSPTVIYTDRMERDHLTSFEEVSEWITDNPRRLWDSAFPDRSMPIGFSIDNLRMGHPDYQETGLWTPRGDQPSGGFVGKMCFSLSEHVGINESCDMFRDLKIHTFPAQSWAIRSPLAWKRARDNGLDTHTICFAMLGDDWVTLSVYLKLAECHD